MVHSIADLVIEGVKLRPFLYKKDHTDFPNVIKRRQAYIEIAVFISEYFGEPDLISCKYNNKILF